MMRLLPALAGFLVTTASASEPEAVEGLDVTEFIDVLSTRVTHTAGMDFDGPTRGDVDFTTASVFALLGNVELAPGWNWVPALRYQFSSLDMNALPFGANPAAPRLDQGLHGIALDSFLIHAPDGSRWLHGAYLSAGLNSDFSVLDSRDISLAAAIGSGYRFSDELLVGFGVYGSNLLNDPFIVPAPVFFWEPGEDWLVSYYGPRFIARREIGDNIRFGFEAGWNGGWWGIDAFNAESRLEVDSIRAGLYYRHRIAGDAWVEIGAGYTFANEVKIYSPGGRDLFPGIMGEADPAPYVTVGFSVHRW